MPVKFPVGGIDEVSLKSRWQIVYTLAEAKIIVPGHKLAIARGPDSIRIRTRDGRVNHDTLHERKSMYKVKRGGIDEDAREKEHDDLGVKRRRVLRRASLTQDQDL
jgi:hypothetical protein